jgi:RimJ/RimL family protein N-acetyltransferase
MKRFINDSYTAHPLLSMLQLEAADRQLTEGAEKRIVDPFKLRPLQLSDAPRVLALMSDTQCVDLAIKPMKTLSQAQQFVSGEISSHVHRYGIVHQAHGLVGGAAWGIYSNGAAFISYWVFPPYQRKGLGKKAVSSLLNEIKQQGIMSVYADVYADNITSIALLKGLGFTCLKKTNDGTARATECFELIMSE